MNKKWIAIVGGGVVTLAALAMLLRDSEVPMQVARGPAAGDGLAADSDAETDNRWGSRPKIFGRDTDGQRDDDAEPGWRDPRSFDDGGRGPSRGAGDRGREHEAGGSGRGGAPLRGRLEDSSVPFEVTEGGSDAGGARRPRGDTRHGQPPDVADVDVIDVPDEPKDETQPVLSLFDGDAVTSGAEASVNRGVDLENDEARFSEESEYAIPMAGRITGEAGSISFWAKPESETADLDRASLVQLRSHYKFNDRLQIWKDGGSVRLVVADSNGIESGTSYASESWAPDEWRLITATWREGEAALYVNGELAGTSAFEGLKIHNDTLLHVASNYPEDPPGLKGSVTDFRVYDYDLLPDEVAQLPSQYPD